MSAPNCDDAGSLTATALVVLAGLLVLIAAFVAMAGAAVRRVETARVAADEEHLAWAALLDVVDRLTADPTPTVTSSRDPAFNDESDDDAIRIEIEDISSRLNPNWVQRTFLERSSLSALGIIASMPNLVQEWRFERWFTGLSDPRLVELFSLDTVESLLSTHSYANVNTTGEIALERLYAEITGDEGAASIFRNRVQQSLQEQRMITGEELPLVLSPYSDEMSVYVTTEPQVNVNLAPDELVRAIVEYPPFEVPNASAIASNLLALRDARDVERGELRDIVGAEEGSRLYEYLGSISWFVRVTVDSGEATFRAIVARRPQAMREDDTYRIISWVRLVGDESE